MPACEREAVRQDDSREEGMTGGERCRGLYTSPGPSLPACSLTHSRQELSWERGPVPSVTQPATAGHSCQCWERRDS